MFWTLLHYTVAKAYDSPRNLTCFTRSVLLVRGWGLWTRLSVLSLPPPFFFSLLFTTSSPPIFLLTGLSSRVYVPLATVSYLWQPLFSSPGFSSLSSQPTLILPSHWGWVSLSLPSYGPCGVRRDNDRGPCGVRRGSMWGEEGVHVGWGGIMIGVHVGWGGIMIGVHVGWVFRQY